MEYAGMTHSIDMKCVVHQLFALKNVIIRRLVIDGGILYCLLHFRFCCIFLSSRFLDKSQVSP